MRIKIMDAHLVIVMMKNNMEIVRRSIEYYFPHFSGRLLERYGIDITIDEYKRLCEEPIELLYVLTPNKRFGRLKIKGVDVLVVRCNASKLLNTALTINGTLPVPRRYRKSGISPEQFSDDLRDALSKIDHLRQCFNEMDKRDFFVNKPCDYPNWMYGAAYSKEREFNHHFLVRVVRNLYRN
jgi:hypothetical protein